MKDLAAGTKKVSPLSLDSSFLGHCLQGCQYHLRPPVRELELEQHPRLRQVLSQGDGVLAKRPGDPQDVSFLHL